MTDWNQAKSIVATVGGLRVEEGDGTLGASYKQGAQQVSAPYGLLTQSIVNRHYVLGEKIWKPSMLQASFGTSAAGPSLYKALVANEKQADGLFPPGTTRLITVSLFGKVGAGGEILPGSGIGPVQTLYSERRAPAT